MKSFCIILQFLAFGITCISIVSLNIQKNLFFFKNPSISRARRAIMLGLYGEWTFPIEYMISPRVNSSLVEKAIEIIQTETCIKFKKVSKVENSGIKFINNGICGSNVGKENIAGPQEIGISKDCDYIAGALHEISHMLGVIHEMIRPDRDNYVKFNREKMDPLIEYNFDKEPEDYIRTYGLKYDYGSVMHYDRIAGAINREIITMPKDKNYLHTIGQKTQFGFNDAKLLNYHYCNSTCQGVKLPCENGGYPNPHKCTECKCPRFYTGKYCENLLPSDPTCGERVLIATDQFKEYTMEGKKSCYIQILAPVGFKVKLKLIEALFEESFVCEPGTGLEVKYYKDKSVSGAIFCGHVTNKVVISEYQTVIMRYVGKADNHKIKIKYERIKA
uniref:Metalloendopeptidase n=1 Tax=Parastrongyloides trichosuri TaxID=131310 RepID=A0A0N4Z2X6_PARTI